MKYLRLIYTLFIFILLLSCGKPAKDSPELNFIELIKTSISLLNETKNKGESFTAYIKKISGKFNAILKLQKDSIITIDSAEAKYDKNDLIYSMEHNKFIVAKTIFITLENYEPAYSLDSKVWYSVKNDINKSIESIKYNYEVESYGEDNNVLIKYKLSLGVGEKPIFVKVNKNKKIILLKKEMIFSSSINGIKKNDLNSIILEIPAGTILYGHHIFRGNIIETQYINGKIIIKADKDVFFYMKNSSSLLISLDKKNWGMNFFTSYFSPGIEMYAREDKEIFLNLSTTLSFSSSEMSTITSIFKLILINK